MLNCSSWSEQSTEAQDVLAGSMHIDSLRERSERMMSTEHSPSDIEVAQSTTAGQAAKSNTEPTLESRLLSMARFACCLFAGNDLPNDLCERLKDSIQESSEYEYKKKSGGEEELCTRLKEVVAEIQQYM